MIIKFLKPFSFLPAIIIMYMIYSFSAQDGTTSSNLSYQVSYKIVEVGGEVLGADLQPWEVDQLATRFHVPVRKLAHMTEYFLLAVAMAFPLYVYGLRGILLLFTAGILCVGFACGDEYHQAYVDGRGPSRMDVLIDSAGVFIGIIFVRIIGWAGRKTIFRPFARAKNRTEQPDPGIPPQLPPQYGMPGYQGQAYPPMRPGSRPAERPRQPYPRSDPYAKDGAYSRNDPYIHDSAYPRSDPYAQRGAYSRSDPYPPDEPGRYGRDFYEDIYDEDFSEEDDPGTSDRLSEDMSFRKLVSDLRDQKQARRDSKSRK